MKIRGSLARASGSLKNCRKTSILRCKVWKFQDISHERLVLRLPLQHVSSRFFVFLVASPCPWGKLQNLSFLSFDTLLFTLHTPHFTLYTPHFLLYTLHSTLYTPHSTLHTLHFTLHTLHSTLHSLHFTL